jgi:hypothetical protein
MTDIRIPTGRKRLVALAALVVIQTTQTATAKTAIEWDTTPPLSGSVVDSMLVIETTDAGTIPLLVIDSPQVGPPRFQIDATIRYEDVAAGAYLEMWTVLADGSRFFTRTLAETGPMAMMTGSSGERLISMPFELGEDGPVPERLEINLVTAGSGRFWISPLFVIPADESPATSATPTSQAAPTTSASSEVTAAAGSAGSVDGASGPGWWAPVGGLVAAGAALALVMFARRRANREQRRMEAIDSLR